MKKGLTDLIMVIDKSGSMYGLTDDTIGGFNSMIDKQRAEEGEAVVTTVLFNDKADFIHDRFNIDDIKAMDSSQYVAEGSTALLDALGTAIQKEIAVQRNLPDNARAEKVIFVIITDGMENSSVEYRYKDIKKMIEHEQKKYGWEFIFLGANMDAVAEGARFGIRADRAVRYKADGIGTALNYSVVSDALSMMRCTEDSRAVGSEWKEEIEKDIEHRGV